MAVFSTILQGIGLVTLSVFAWRLCNVLWIYCFHRSDLSVYRHASDGSWALVTGASDGIGIEVARELLGQGFNVFIHGRNASKLAGVKDELLKAHPGRAVREIVVDASQRDINFQDIVQQVTSVPGKLTVLVNNVGGQPFEPRYPSLEEQAPEDIDRVIDINARFPTRLTAVLLPVLKRNKPVLIVNCGSFGGVVGVPYIATYTGTKAYIHTFTSAIRDELMSESVEGVEVCCSLIGNTSSSTNKTYMAGATITANECARGILARVGCGQVVVAPHWRHWAVGAFLSLVPDGVARKGMAGSMRQRKEDERKEIEARKKMG